MLEEADVARETSSLQRAEGTTARPAVQHQAGCLSPSLSILVTIAQHVMEATKARGVTSSKRVSCCQLALPSPRAIRSEHYSFLYLEFFFRVTKYKPGDGIPFQPSKDLVPLVLRQLSHTQKTPMN